MRASLSLSQHPARRLAAIIVIGGALAPAALHGQPALDERVTSQITPGKGLTADEAAKRARATSFDMAAQREEVAAAHAALDSAKAGYIPKLTATARYTRLSAIEAASLGNLVAAPGAPAGPLASDAQLVNVPLKLESLENSYDLTAQINIPVSDYFLRVAPSVSAARSGERAARLNAGATERQVEVDARSAYYSWVRARLSVTVAEQAVEQSRAHLVDVKKAQDVGSASKADVLRVESLVASAELTLVKAKNNAELAESQLRTTMHDAGNEPLAIGEDVLADQPAEEQRLDALTRRALDAREELGALDASADSLRQRAKATRSAVVPRLDLFASATYANPNQRIFPQADQWDATWQAGAQLSWTISDIPQALAASRESEAKAASLAAQRAAAADGIRIQVLSASQSVSYARAAVAATTTNLVTAEEAYRVRRALFQNGRATSLELTDAELDLTRSRLDAINARVDLRVATAQLERATAAK